MTLDQLWNGWRAEYVNQGNANSTNPQESVFTQILNSQLSDEEACILFRGKEVFALLNAYPYATGHLMVLPYRQVADLEDLSASETTELWNVVTNSVRAVKTSHRPDAVNVGINLGAAAGGSISMHLHVHVVPRWNGDSNFMTSVANTRTLPEPMSDTAKKIRDSWPAQ